MGTTINKSDALVEQSQTKTQQSADAMKAHAIGTASSSVAGLGGGAKPPTPPPAPEKTPPPAPSSTAGSTGTPNP